MPVSEHHSKVSGRMTAQDLLELPSVPGVQLELNEGVLVEMPGACVAHHLIVMAIVRLLDAFVREHDLDYVLPDGVSYLLRRDPDVLPIPDALFLTSDQLPDEAALEGY